MSQFITSPEVERPSVLPLTSSALHHAEKAGNVHSIERFGLRNNEGLWPSYNCLDTLVPTPICPNPASTFFKSFGSAPWVPGFSFAVHGGVQCSMVALDREDQRAEMERVFAANEGKGVERALLVNRFVARQPESGDTAPDMAYWDAPVDLTAGRTVSLITALALLEGYAAANYTGLPTIHMPRAVASLLNERIVWNDGLAYTRNGSKVAIGGGYDYVEAADYDGSWDMYATGEVYVERGERLSFSEITVPGDGSGTGSGQNGLADNTAVTLIERMFRVGVDCFTAKATGSVATLTSAGF